MAVAMLASAHGFARQWSLRARTATSRHVVSAAADAASGTECLRSRLLRGGHSYGPMLMSGSPLIAELLAGVGYGHLVVDHEHSPVDVTSGVAMLQAIDAAAAGAYVASAGAPRTEPIVRVPSSDTVYLKKVLDTLRPPGGVIVPMVETAAEAAAVVSACRYPPRGVRGCAHPFVRASGWGMDAAYADDDADDNADGAAGGSGAAGRPRCEAELLVCVQVESAAAVEHVAEIAAVPGVDCVFLGPFDISCSVGKMGQFEDPQVAALLARAEQQVLAVAAARRGDGGGGGGGGWGPILGGFRPPGRALDEMYAGGYQLVCGGVDLGLLREAAKADVMAERHAHHPLGSLGGAKASSR